MNSGWVAGIEVGGQTGGAEYDSYITFTETISEMSTFAGETTLYLTNTAEADLSADTDLEAWTSRGAGVQSVNVNTATGWTAPIQIGSRTWWTRPLKAVTLSGKAQLSMWIVQSAFANNASCGAEIAVTNGDGSGAVVWGYANKLAAAGSGGSGNGGDMATTAASHIVWIAGHDLAITSGQRLRIRVFIDDRSDLAMVSGGTATFYWASTSSGASGDSYITLPVQVSEEASRYVLWIMADD
jgi:hypothetical protein